MRAERLLGLAILAAGASSRLGQCKALVPLGGGAESTPLVRLLQAGRALDADDALIIGGAHQAELSAFQAEHALQATLVENQTWEAGRSGSVLTAHQALPKHDLCLAPVDVPLVSRAVFEALGRAWRSAGSPSRGWLAPAFRDAGSWRHGHPVILGHGLLADLRDLPVKQPLRDLRVRAEPMWDVEVADRGILDDLDDEQDLLRLRKRLGI